MEELEIFTAIDEAFWGLLHTFILYVSAADLSRMAKAHL